MQRLEIHLELLARWNPRINLVARSTLAAAWARHVADSAQLWPLRPPGARLWLDLGSGAGFPGLVIAALAAEAEPDLEVRLVESDARKAAFLFAAAREAQLSARILDVRVEDLPPQGADVVSARALAPLSILLGMAENHRRPGGTGLFPKGATVQNEIAEAARHWRFNHKIHTSLTDPQAAIVEIGAIDRA
jgi:16S rRNA (guanine527-N7)-methyltransferase